jgi:hypothetical protein
MNPLSWAASTVSGQVSGLADRLLPAVVEAVISRVDVTDLVARYVDLDRLVATVDVDAIAWRLDLLTLADYIIDGVDLPDIVRSSSASLTTEAVHRLRERGVDADDAVSRAVGRLLPRRHS